MTNIERIKSMINQVEQHDINRFHDLPITLDFDAFKIFIAIEFKTIGMVESCRECSADDLHQFSVMCETWLIDDIESRLNVELRLIKLLFQNGGPTYH